jgi:hypothetical protein
VSIVKLRPVCPSAASFLPLTCACLPVAYPPCCRFFYASSACIYPEHKQLETEVEGGGLKEGDAWPAQVSTHTHTVNAGF